MDVVIVVVSVVVTVGLVVMEAGWVRGCSAVWLGRCVVVSYQYEVKRRGKGKNYYERV